MILPLFLIVVWGCLGYQIGRIRERGQALHEMRRLVRELDRCEAMVDPVDVSWTYRP